MTIKHCGHLRGFKADAPKLRLAEYIGHQEDLEIFSLRNAVDLMDAKLEFHGELDKGVSGFVKLAQAFGQARILKIKCYENFSPENSKLKSLLENCSPCYNVKQLILQLGPASSVAGLLKIFPKLEDLTLEHEKRTRRHHSYNSALDWRDLDDCRSNIVDLKARSIMCLNRCLGKITFEHFRGYDDEVALAKVLVKNAMVSEKMCLNDCWGPFDHLWKIRNKLRRKRGCKSAKIIYN